MHSLCTDEDLAQWVFGDMVSAGLRLLRESKPSNEALEFLSKRAVLAPKNDVVRALNDKILLRFPAESVFEAQPPPPLLVSNIGFLLALLALNFFRVPQKARVSAATRPFAVIVPMPVPSFFQKYSLQFSF